MLQRVFIYLSPTVKLVDRVIDFLEILLQQTINIFCPASDLEHREDILKNKVSKIKSLDINLLPALRTEEGSGNCGGTRPVSSPGNPDNSHLPCAPTLQSGHQTVRRSSPPSALVFLNNDCFQPSLKWSNEVEIFKSFTF